MGGWWWGRNIEIGLEIVSIYEGGWGFGEGGEGVGRGDGFLNGSTIVGIT